MSELTLKTAETVWKEEPFFLEAFFPPAAPPAAAFSGDGRTFSKTFKIDTIYFRQNPPKMIIEHKYSNGRGCVIFNLN